MATRKRPTQKHFDILTGMEIIEKPEVKAPVTESNPPPVELTETYKHPEKTPDEIMKEEYPELMRSPDATQILLCILKELVMSRKGVHA